MNMRMNYKIIIIILYLLVSPDLMAQIQKKDTAIEKSVQMAEVVVKGEKRILKGDHTILLLSKNNRNFGTNALDAVSSLGFFQTKLNETELKSFDNKEVFILINGIPATALDLRSFKAEDIKNVEYYPIAPAQYMALASGPVANIVMKKKQDKFISAYVNTNNAVNTGFGTNQVNLTYADSLNQVKINYFVDYRNIDNIHLDSYYDYGNENKTIYIGDNNKYKGTYQYVQGSYQRFQARHLFNANVKYIWNPRNQSYSSNISIPAKITDGKSEDYMKSNSNTLVADLFYRYSLGHERSLNFNIVNTLTSSNSFHSMKQNYGDFLPEMAYQIDENVKNRTYSFIANIVYSSPFLKGALNVGAKYEYLHLRQHYLEDIYNTTSHTAFLYTGIYWNIKGITLYPSLGLYYSRQTTETANYNQTIPYLRLYTDWWGKNAWQGFSFQFTTQIKMQSPTSGQLTASETHIDRNFISSGNPDIKAYWQWNNNLLFAYFSPKNNNQIVLQYTPKYSHHPFANVLYRDKGIIYSKPTEISHVFDNEISMYGSWFPVSWLEISPYTEYYYSTFDTPSKKVRFSYFRVGGNITLSHKKWALGIYANSPTKEVAGDFTTRGSAQYSVTFQYKYKNWAFGAKWNYFAHNDYTEGMCNEFYYKENKDCKSLHSLFRITAIWSFSKGKVRKHQTKSLNNESLDDGLTNDNTPKMAK